MIKAVIFDMDGVIIDSELVYLEQMWEFGKTRNPQMKLEELYPMVGASKADAWSVLARAMGQGQTWEEARADLKAHVDLYRDVDYRKIFRPEIRQILAELKKKGYKLAVASSTQLPLVERVMRENGIIDQFEILVSGNQFEKSKPDPEIYLYTAAKLGVKPEECLAVEDSTFGVLAGHRAGMTVAALKDDRFQFDQSPADYRMDRLTEVLEILKRMEG
ncbi:carbohydrate phosphatase [Lachnoclostridium sp. An14]|uniref:HAD family hydrolase n=1 Tax=Lachnoclostridium sp. An14 TaxID=1965562 RepID=UPI000B39CC50|nr:HAD family phosphatase [Lachnoclostridium sp. An14]OUQ13964.1 carbohydrate phosphatase [Lachnoclostridium sp. An14]